MDRQYVKKLMVIVMGSRKPEQKEDGEVNENVDVLIDVTVNKFHSEWEARERLYRVILCMFAPRE